MGVSLFAVGVILAIAGNTLIASALTLQKYTHNIEKATGVPADKQPLFWFSIVGMIGGEVGNFAAFGFASPTVVSPLGAVAVIVNGVLAALVLQENLRVRNIVGMALTIVGSVVVVINAPPTHEGLSVADFVALLAEPSSVAYLALLSVSVAVLYALEPPLGSTILLVNLMLCSTLGSVTVLCSSAFSKFLGQFLAGDTSLLWQPIVYIVPAVMGATAVLQLKFLNQAMGHFDSSRVVPTYYVTFTICSISGGGVVLQDFWRFSTAGAVGFVAGCLLCFLGVGLITYQARRSTRNPTADDIVALRRAPPEPWPRGDARAREQAEVAPKIADAIANEVLPSPEKKMDILKRSIRKVRRLKGSLDLWDSTRLEWATKMDAVALGSKSNEELNPSLFSGPAAFLVNSGSNSNLFEGADAAKSPGRQSARSPAKGHKFAQSSSSSNGDGEARRPSPISLI